MRHSQVWTTFATLLQITAGLVNVVKSKTGQSTVRYKTWLPHDEFLCHGQTTHHTGWADFNGRHLFFWFHESRRGPDAPLLIWFQGGPGGSSLHGMLFENGPCLMNDGNSTTFNPYSWTNSFNVVYLDQPAGVGYSYVNDPKNESTYHSHVEDSSLDVVAFINLFYEAFPEMKLVDLHLGGESYAGRYVPSVGAAILDYNQFFIRNSSDRSEDPTIYLRSLLVGNPLFHPAVQLPTLYDVSCHEYRGKYPPHFDPADCAEVETVVDQCEALLYACAQDTRKRYLCTQASDLCFKRYMEKFVRYHRSSYDRRLRDCRGDGDCYPDVDHLISYLNSPEVINDKLEVSRLSGGRKGQWDMMNEIITYRYMYSGDMWRPTTDAIERILDYSSNSAPAKDFAPVDILFYVGVADVICNADGVLAGMLDLHWKGHTEFRSTPWKELPWNSSTGNRAGRVKISSNLWMAEIEDAGHMVPLDQPESSLRMVNSWLQYVYNGSLPLDTERSRSPFSPVGKNRISASDWRVSIGDGEL